MDKEGSLAAMATPKKPIKKARQVRVYFSGENEEALGRLCESMPDFQESEIVRVLVSASLRAIKENGFRLPFPLNFKVVETPTPREAGAFAYNEKSR